MENNPLDEPLEREKLASVTKTIIPRFLALPLTLNSSRNYPGPCFFQAYSVPHPLVLGFGIVPRFRPGWAHFAHQNVRGDVWNVSVF